MKLLAIERMNMHPLMRLLMAAIGEVGSLSLHDPRSRVTGSHNGHSMETAFLKLLEKNHALIKKICRSYSNQRADQEDLYQEIIFQLWKAYPTYKGDSKITTWMYSLALRTSILPFRTRRIAESTVMDELPGEPAVEPVSPDDFDDRLFKFFQRLGNTDRSILVLLMEGYNNKEIGTMLKLSQDAVAQRISRVRKSITNN